MSESTRRYLNTQEAADYLGISPKTLTKMRGSGGGGGPRYSKGRTAGDLRHPGSRFVGGGAQAALHGRVGGRVSADGAGTGPGMQKYFRRAWSIPSCSGVPPVCSEYT